MRTFLGLAVLDRLIVVVGLPCCDLMMFVFDLRYFVELLIVNLLHLLLWRSLNNLLSGVIHDAHYSHLILESLRQRFLRVSHLPMLWFKVFGQQAIDLQ